MPIVVWFIYWGIQALIMLVVVGSILSWFRPDPSNPLVKMLNAVVDPLLHPIRTILPATGGMDFSPMIAILILWFLQKLLTGGIAH
jgi:YggT family protein